MSMTIGNNGHPEISIQDQRLQYPFFLSCNMDVQPAAVQWAEILLAAGTWWGVMDFCSWERLPEWTDPISIVPLRPRSSTIPWLTLLEQDFSLPPWHGNKHAHRNVHSEIDQPFWNISSPHCPFSVIWKEGLPIIALKSSFSEIAIRLENGLQEVLLLHCSFFFPYPALLKVAKSECEGYNDWICLSACGGGRRKSSFCILPMRKND